VRRVGNVKPGPSWRLWYRGVQRLPHAPCWEADVFLDFRTEGWRWCTRITRVRGPAVVARGSLEATTLLSVAGGAGGRELLSRCYQTIPNHADPQRPASVPSVEIFEPYSVVGLRGNPLGITA